jgi:hypothetical protein
MTKDRFWQLFWCRMGFHDWDSKLDQENFSTVYYGHYNIPDGTTMYTSVVYKVCKSCQKRKKVL